MAQYKNEGQCQRLVVTGCLAQRYAQDIAREIPEVDVVTGLDGVENIVSACETPERRVEPSVAVKQAAQGGGGPGDGGRQFRPVREPCPEAVRIRSEELRTRVEQRRGGVPVAEPNRSSKKTTLKSESIEASAERVFDIVAIAPPFGLKRTCSIELSWSNPPELQL